LFAWKLRGNTIEPWKILPNYTKTNSIHKQILQMELYPAESVERNEQQSMI